MGAEAGVPDAILGCRPEGQAVALEGLAEADVSAFEADEAAILDFADDVRGAVLGWLDSVWEAPGAWPVALGRDGHADPLMWAVGVVDMAPSIEVLLTVLEVAELPADEYFSIDGAMESLVLRSEEHTSELQSRP